MDLPLQVQILLGPVRVLPGYMISFPGSLLFEYQAG